MNCLKCNREVRFKYCEFCGEESEIEDTRYIASKNNIFNYKQNKKQIIFLSFTLVIVTIIYFTNDFFKSNYDKDGTIINFVNNVTSANYKNAYDMLTNVEECKTEKDFETYIKKFKGKEVKNIEQKDENVTINFKNYNEKIYLRVSKDFEKKFKLYESYNIDIDNAFTKIKIVTNDEIGDIKIDNKNYSKEDFKKDTDGYTSIKDFFNVGHEIKFTKNKKEQVIKTKENMQNVIIKNENDLAILNGSDTKQNGSAEISKSDLNFEKEIIASKVVDDKLKIELADIIDNFFRLYFNCSTDKNEYLKYIDSNSMFINKKLMYNNDDILPYNTKILNYRIKQIAFADDYLTIAGDKNYISSHVKYFYDDDMKKKVAGLIFKKINGKWIITDFNIINQESWKW